MLQPIVLLSGLSVLSAAASFAGAQETQPDPLPSIMVPVAVDSGEVRHAGAEAASVFSADVVAPGAQWVRLWFDDASLPAGSYLLITSAEDGAWQRLDAEHLANWSMSSAYFNGDTVTLELFAAPGGAASRVSVAQVMAGLPPADPRSICDGADDRVLSYDTRNGRLSSGCTGWLIDHEGSANRFLTAGHCISNGTTGAVMFFNVPLSTASGGFRPPSPEYQYPVQNGSIQSVGSGGVGNDFATFQTHPNSNTGLAPMTAQGAAYELAPAAPAAVGQPVRVTGFGLRDGNAPQIPQQWSRTQKTHTGPLTSRGTTSLRYRPDTTGGNSGSPVILESTGQAIGIHTHGGCNSTGGSNAGTAIEHPGLQNYLANPRGTSIPQAPLREVATTFAGDAAGATGGAVYFDLAPTRAVHVRGLELNVGSVGSTEFSVRVYTTPGSAAGALDSPAGWTLVGEGWGLAAGADAPTRVVLADSFVLDAGSSSGVAVVLSGASHRYSNADGAEQFASGGLTLTAGWASDTPFAAPSFDGRVFSGSVLFEFANGECPADFNADGLLNFFDVAAFATALQSQSPSADLNSDGLFNFFDFSLFIDVFNVGCP